MDLLNDEEIINLTKAKQPNKQAAILDSHGIFYITRLDGTITTTWHHVNHPQGDRLTSNDSIPNYAALTGNG